LKNINFDSRIPSLQKIKDTIDASSPPHIDITLSELNYIRSMSFKKLFLFITQLKNKEHIKPLVRKLIQYFYTDINITMKQFIFGLRRHTYYYNQDPMFEYQHEMMKYMGLLSDLLLKESGIFNLFIEENISRFLHDVDIQKRHNTILNVPTQEGKIYEHILFDGGVYGDISGQLDGARGDLRQIEIVSLLGNPETLPSKPYSGVVKLILGKGFSGFAEGYSGSENLLSTIFTTFPNLRELVFRDCFNSAKSSTNTFSLGSVRAIHLTSLILKNTKINLDFNQFENLEYLEVENNPSIKFLNLQNKKIKNVVLTNLKILSILNVNKLKLDLLKLVNINQNVRDVSIGEVGKLVIEESFPKEIATSKKIFDLQLSDVRLRLVDLKKVIPVSGGFSLGRRKTRSASLNFVNIFITRTTEQLMETRKKELLSYLKGLRYLDLNFINFVSQVPGSRGQTVIKPIKFSNTDLLVLDKKTQVTICRENFQGDRTERRRDITIN
jgi:hypothetical protein